MVKKRAFNKRLLVVMMVMTGTMAYADTPTITDVTAQQRYPWNGKVDITYTATGIANEAKQKSWLTSLKVTAIDMVANTTNIATQLSGDLSFEDGTHAIVWDMNADGLTFKSSNIVFNVACEMTNVLYCVIDLSEGATATSYPITYLAEPPSGGFNVDEYKTSKLVLRLIEAGTFIMGAAKDDESHRVTLTKPFFCGLFEVTQKQYTLVMGENPSNFSGDTRPVETVGYNMIRGSSDGAKWPSSSSVDSSSFMGKLRVRTGLDFDLPTEAQWEYACRAGTTTAYSYGNFEDGAYMWDNSNSYSQTHPVGSKRGNQWGLYDMHGNVWEWCLDWYGTLTYGTDPIGSFSGSYRVRRGGSWGLDWQYCRSFNRDDYYNYSNEGYSGYGFRIVRTLSNSLRNTTMCSSDCASVTLDLATGTRTTATSETILYSTAWVDGTSASATAVVEVNGETLTSVSGSGDITWTPQHNGTYMLTHKVMSGDEQIGETLAATFFVEPLNPVLNPASGSTFESSLSVSMSCATEGATIHYTTDGSEPTADSPVYRRFRIYGKTTVKAIAEKNGVLSDVVTAEYALGQCADPVFSLTDGAEFAHSNQSVSIRWKNDGVLRYTLDGTDPTAASPIYEGPFTFSDSVELRAKVFSDDYFDSAVVTSRLTRVWENVATPQIDVADSFTGSKAKVVITCATEGATIRYTLDGSEPDGSSAVYAGPIYVTDSCTVKVYAVNVDYLDSAVATQAIVKEWDIGDSLGKPDHGFTTDGSAGAGWVRFVDATAPNGDAMKSGAITHNQQSVLVTKVMGPGTLTFSWRTSCEDSGGLYDWDHVEFAVDGAVRLQRDGINSWTDESIRVDGNGEHTITWTYKKDDVESEGDDAAYVAGYGWASDYTETKTTEVSVPYTWLLQHDSEIVDEFDAYESAAKATAANGYNKVWECYVAGISPTNETAKFTAGIEIVGGVPQVTWSPNLNTNGIERIYTIWGKTNLTDGVDWECPTNAAHRFFKVTVEMP